MTGKEIYEIAEGCLGVPYLSGGASLSGFDAAGLVYYCHKQLGITVARYTDGYIQAGKGGNGTIGEVVCWPGHAGICDGNSHVIHANKITGKVQKDLIRDVNLMTGSSPIGYRILYSEE